VTANDPLPPQTIMIISDAQVRTPAVQAMLTKLGITHPVTVQHQLTRCDKCGDDGWIGPTTRDLANSRPDLPKWCTACLVMDTRIGQIGMVGLNPTIDEVPRREL
jgi:hypothetical protein